MIGRKDKGTTFDLPAETIHLGMLTGLIVQDGDEYRLTEKGEKWMREWMADRIKKEERKLASDPAYPDSLFSNVAKLRKRRKLRRAKNKIAKQSRKVNR